MPNASQTSRTLVGLLVPLIVSCASAPDVPSPAPTKKLESVGRTASAVSISPLPSDPGATFDEPPLLTNMSRKDTFAGVKAAFDGTRYFFSWSDYTHGGARVGSFLTESGAPLAQNILLAPPPPPRVDYQLVDMAASSLGAISTWLMRDTSFNKNLGIAGACALPDGTVARFELADAVTSYTAPTGGYQTIYAPAAVAADASAFHILYFRANPAGGVELVYRRLNQTGEPGAPTSVISKLANGMSGGSAAPISLVSNGEALFAAWQGFNEGGQDFATFRYFTMSVAAPGPATIRTYTGVGAYQRGLAPATGGFRAVAADGSQTRIVSFDSAGNVTAEGPGFSNVGNQYFRNAARTNDPNTFIAAIGHNDDTTCMQYISTTGPVGACAPFTLSPDRGSADSFGFDGFTVGKTTLVEVFPRNSTNPSKGARYPLANLTAPETVSIASIPVHEELPSIATDGNGYLIAWRDTRSPVDGFESPAIFAQRLDADGKSIGSAVQISTRIAYFSSTSVIFDGKKYAVLWTEKDNLDASISHVMLGLVSASGDLNVEKRIEVGTTTVDGGFVSDVSLFSVASDGVNRVVVWNSEAGKSLGIYGARVSLDTDALVDTSPVLITKGVGYTFPAVPQIVFGGKRMLLVWIDFAYLTAGVVGGFLEPGKLEITGTPFSLINTGAYIGGLSSVASDSDTFFVACQQFASEAGGMGVRGAYITEDGTIAGFDSAGKWVKGDPTATIPVAPQSASVEDLTMAYAKDKANFVSVWSNKKDKELDVYGAWIDPRSGYLRDPDGVPVAARSNTLERRPSVAIRKDGKGVVAYQEFVESIGAYRLRLRAIDSGSLIGAACTTNNDCGTRECVGGVCCESACNEGCGVCNVVPGTCTPKAKGSACGAANTFACSGESTTCPAGCTTNDDCVSKRCVSGVCDIPSVRCVDDSHLSDEQGNITDCGDYKCNANACRTPCREVSDCRDGLVCTFDGACVTPPPLPDAPEGCMKSSVTSGRVSEMNMVSLSALAIVVGSLVRRRSSRSKGGVQ